MLFICCFNLNRVQKLKTKQDTLQCLYRLRLQIDTCKTADRPIHFKILTCTAFDRTLSIKISLFKHICCIIGGSHFSLNSLTKDLSNFFIFFASGLCETILALVLYMKIGQSCIRSFPVWGVM